MRTWRQVNIVKTLIMAKSKMDYNGIGFSNKIEASDFKALRKK